MLEAEEGCKRWLLKTFRGANGSEERKRERDRVSETEGRGGGEKRREDQGTVFIAGDGGRHVGMDARRPLTR